MRKRLTERGHCVGHSWIYEFMHTSYGKHWILSWMEENQTATYFLHFSYLRMILWKNSTAISIKHRVLATFNKIKKKSILNDCMPLNTNDSTCRKHFPVLSSFMTYHRVCNWNNTSGATSGARTAYPSGAPEFTPGF
jgi:ribosome biogenesis protein Nip4